MVMTTLAELNGSHGAVSAYSILVKTHFPGDRYQYSEIALITMKLL